MTIDSSNPVLIVDKTTIKESNDSSGSWNHYRVCLRDSENREIDLDQFPIDRKKYGKIQGLILSNGKEEVPLGNDFFVKRLIKFLSTDFEELRKKMNQEQIDQNGYYPNRRNFFDCQRFSYYLQNGKEGTYSLYGRKQYHEGYRSAQFLPGRFYSISAKTPEFGKNGEYRKEHFATHHFMCLSDDLFVSKYGMDQIFFTSQQQILDAYFPEKFSSGCVQEERF